MDRKTAPVFRLALVALAALAVGGPTAGCTTDAAAARRPAAAGREAPATVSLQFASGKVARPSAPSSPPASPIGLTASDGTGLALVALEARGVVDPPLAFTELHLTFENPREETIEGRFRIALPQGAALSRFAMKIGDRWQEGEVVERQRARVAYEDFLHRRQDPALLEHEAGNEFSARVFPIPARGRKEIVVSYSHALTAADEPYVLPLRGLATVGRLDVEVVLGEHPADRAAGAPANNLGGEVHDRRIVALHRRDWTPDRDFEIGQDAFPGRAGLRHANLAVVRVEAPVEPVPEEIAGLFALVDSSASRAYDYAGQVDLVGELVAGLRDGAGAATPVAVAAFDQEVAPLYEGTAGGFGAGDLARLRERRPLGASDLAGALGWLGERLAGSPGRYPRVVLFTDGVATAGEIEGRALKAAVAALAARGVERLDVVALGGLRDGAALRELVTGNLDHDGQVIDGAAPLAEIGRRLTLACRSGIAVAVEGADWVWPDTLDGVQPGDQILVYADLPAERPFRLALAGRPEALGDDLGDGLAGAERPLLERAWVQARIERLLHLREAALGGDADLRRALALQVTELSVRHRVVSPFTAFLVLETEADYRRFDLDRRALADILTVGPSGLDVLARSAPPPIPSAGTGAAAKSAVEIAAGDAPAGIIGGRADDALGATGTEAPAEMGAEVEGRALSVSATSIDAGEATAGAGRQPATPAIPDPTPAEPDGVDFPPRIAEEILVTGEPQRRREVLRPRRQARIAGREAPATGGSPTGDDDEEADKAPYGDRFAEVMAHLAAGETAAARRTAESWQSGSPGDVLALVALGEAWEAAGEPAAAARAYGSLIDLFPSRADLRRTAGERLERLGTSGLALAIDTYAKAVEQRPDHPSGHRLLAWALFRAGRVAEAFAALEQGLDQRYPPGRFAEVDRILREDLGLVAAAWLAVEPERRDAVLARLESHAARLEAEPSLRFVLTWETDANDVDLHVFDRKGGHAFYNEPELASGGRLYADVTTGYGPECFTVPAPAKRHAGPYQLKAHYYRRGPMGYGMGTVQVVDHDGAGGVTLDPRPFVVMADGATVDLGTTGRGGKRNKAAK